GRDPRASDQREVLPARVRRRDRRDGRNDARRLLVSGAARFTGHDRGSADSCLAAALCCERGRMTGSDRVENSVRTAALFLALVLVAVPLLPQGSGDLTGLLAAVDATRNAFDEAIISARATQVTSGKAAASVDFDVYVQGRDHGLIVFRGGRNG